MGTSKSSHFCAIVSTYFFEETQIGTIMMKCFILDRYNFFEFECFRTTESKVFELYRLYRLLQKQYVGSSGRT
jgi:hypothetical protein